MLPFLDREDSDERLKILGFEFDDGNILVDTPEGRKKFAALQELIAGAIADWADVRPEGDISAWDQLNNELNTFAQEFLVG